MLAGGESGESGCEVPVIRSGYAHDIDAVLEQLLNRILASEGGKWAKTLPVSLTQPLRPGAGATGDGAEVHLDQAKVTAKEASLTELLEDRAIGVIENHPQADHADPNSPR